VAGARPRVPATRCRGRADDGFTMIEVLVAIALVTIVMAALTMAYVATTQATAAQAVRQVAAQLVQDGTERVRALKGSAVATGRDRLSSDAQWRAPAAGVGPYLAASAETWDATAAYPAGASAVLPTTAKQVRINGIRYDQYWYVTRCWQPPAGGDCDATPATGDVGFYRVVVAVTWPERHCPAGTCSFVSATLVSSATGDPLFNSNQIAVAPVVTNPGAQAGEVGVATSLTVRAAGGAPPLTWTATGLPPGLTMAPDGTVAGTPTTAGVYSVTAVITDGYALAGSAVFGWTVVPPPALVNPGPQSTPGGVAAALAIGLTGGTAPLTWTVSAPGGWGATGLPPGMAVNPATGTISGTPTTVGTAPVTVTVVDAYGRSSATTFTWTVPALAVTTPAAQAYETGATVAVPVAAAGGIAPYTWSATGLPAGLAIDAASGLISGSPTLAGTSTATVRVVDATGTARSTAGFRWTVTAGPVITVPGATRTDAVGAAVSLQAVATGGTGRYTWSATSLPAGLTIGPTGLITGTVGAGTRYLATLRVTDAAGGSATVTVLWTVTATGANPTITVPAGDRTGDVVGQSVTFTGTATGGSGFTWSGTGLPPGTAISTGGVVSGRPTVAGTYLVTLTVRNSAGRTATVMFLWTIR